MTIKKLSRRALFKQKIWHYQPESAVFFSPLFSKPFDLKAIFLWYLRSWFPVSERLIILLFSFVSCFLFYPSIEQYQQFQFGWISLIFLRNLGLLCLVAGGIHLYLYTFCAQGDKHRYDNRSLERSKRRFTFNNQLLDNIFWSCFSGVPIWTLYEAFMIWAMANDFIPTLPNSGYFLWLIVIIFAIPIWETFYFYVVHRLLHWPPLYRLAHSIHHRNTNVGPWSGLSMHPLEHLLYLASIGIHFVIPSNPLIIVFHLQYYCLSAVTTHSGHESLKIGDKKVLSLGTFHHQLHHRYFDCNYGGLEIPWDRWLGSFHDGSNESHERFLKRRKAMKK